jgi:hypothetical protein
MKEETLDIETEFIPAISCVEEDTITRWEESPSEELCELHPLKAETLVPEKLETEVLQKQEEEELGILQYLDQLEQVTARYFSRFVIKI